MTDRDLTKFLVARGLAAAGSNETIQDLRNSYGVRRWFGFSDVIDLPLASLFPEQTEPFFVNADRTCLLPPTGFECDFDYHRDGPQTHAVALQRLTALFGTPEKGMAVNTLSETWTFQRMSLTIRTFLREKTGGHNPLYKKNPGLWNFCRIAIERNWVRFITNAEARAVNAMGKGKIWPVQRAFVPSIRQPAPWERGLFRLDEEGMIHRPGMPAFLWSQGALIGWSASPWAGFFERGGCRELRLEQAGPARGGGWSRLVLVLDNPFSLEREPVVTAVLSGRQTHTLDETAGEVSTFWDLPLRIEQCWDD